MRRDFGTCTVSSPSTEMSRHGFVKASPHFSTASRATSDTLALEPDGQVCQVGEMASPLWASILAYTSRLRSVGASRARQVRGVEPDAERLAVKIAGERHRRRSLRPDHIHADRVEGTHLGVLGLAAAFCERARLGGLDVGCAIGNARIVDPQRQRLVIGLRRIGRQCLAPGIGDEGNHGCIEFASLLGRDRRRRAPRVPQPK